MKKTLMAGTALVAGGILLSAAPASAAEKIKLGLGGYMEQWFGWSSEDSAYEAANTTANSLDQKSDSEIYFKGSTKLDNGIQVGVKWELEGDSTDVAGSTGGTGAYDEAMLYLSGSFGRINIGKEDTASELLSYGAPSVGPIGLNKSDANDWVRQPAGVSSLTTHNMDLGMSDKNNITYFSPRISGVQFGASYHPEVTEEKDTKQPSSVTHQGWSGGANFVQKVAGANVAFYAAYATQELADGNQGANRTDPYGWGVGGEVGYQNFTFGASYIMEDTTTTATNWNVGLKYSMGMNAFSVGYQESQTTNTGTVTTDDKSRLWQIGYERTLGPGVKWSSGVAHVDWDGAGTGATNDNDGYMVVTGVRLDF
jgi:outer membrane protein OmpU